MFQALAGHKDSHNHMRPNNRILIVDDNNSIHRDFNKVLSNPRAEEKRKLAQIEKGLFQDLFEEEDDNSLEHPDYEVDSTYQEEEANHLIWVEERSEPQMLEFEDVAESVRDDYIERFEEDIYRRVAEKRLDEGGFLYREEALRRLLTDDSG